MPACVKDMTPRQETGGLGGLITAALSLESREKQTSCRKVMGSSGQIVPVETGFIRRPVFTEEPL